MNTVRTAAAVILALAVGSSARAATSTYVFTIDPANGMLTATVNITLDADGNLIGNYDATTTPDGTRTKPGGSGSFGSTENVPVPATFTPGVSGSPTSHPDGGFTLIVDLDANTVLVGGYSTNLLASGPLSLDTSVTVSFSTFRTRAPTSTYFTATLPVPLGQSTLSTLTAMQTGDPVAGTLTPNGPGTYTVAAAVPVDLAGAGDVLGNPFDLPPSPAALALQGTLTITGETAALSGSAPIVIENSGPPSPDGPVSLPPLPLDVPTVFLPGNTAHLIANVSVTNVEASVNGTLTTAASGVRQVVVETGACCYTGSCTVKLPVECLPFVCRVADYLPITFTGCYGDADGNGVVNAVDRGFVTANIGQTDPVLMCQFDMDGNGFINAGDRGFVAANIGLCTAVPDYQNGSGLNGGQPDTRFGQATFMGLGSECDSITCP